MESLPSELRENILLNLSEKELRDYCISNINEPLCRDESFWRRVHNRDFPNFPIGIEGAKRSYLKLQAQLQSLTNRLIDEHRKYNPNLVDRNVIYKTIFEWIKKFMLDNGYRRIESQDEFEDYNYNLLTVSGDISLLLTGLDIDTVGNVEPIIDMINVTADLIGPEINNFMRNFIVFNL